MTRNKMNSRINEINLKYRTLISQNRVIRTRSIFQIQVNPKSEVKNQKSLLRLIQLKLMEVQVLLLIKLFKLALKKMKKS